MGDVAEAVVEVAVEAVPWLLYGPRGGLVASGEEPTSDEAFWAAMVALERVVGLADASDEDVVLAMRQPEGWPIDVKFRSGFRVRIAG